MNRKTKRTAWRRAWKDFEGAFQDTYSVSVWNMIKRKEKRARKIGFILGALFVLATYCAMAWLTPFVL